MTEIWKFREVFILAFCISKGYSHITSSSVKHNFQVTQMFVLYSLRSSRSIQLHIHSFSNILKTSYNFKLSTTFTSQNWNRCLMHPRIINQSNLTFSLLTATVFSFVSLQSDKKSTLFPIKSVIFQKLSYKWCTGTIGTVQLWDM